MALLWAPCAYLAADGKMPSRFESDEQRELDAADVGWCGWSCPALSHQAGGSSAPSKRWWSWGSLLVRHAVRRRHLFAWTCDLCAVLQKQGSVNSELFRNLSTNASCRGFRFSDPSGVSRLAE